MKYWDKTDSAEPTDYIKETKITKDNIKETLTLIKRGYLPDWNYETHEDTTLPDKYYTLHVAMQAAIEAVDIMDDEFFKALDAKYDKN